MKTICIGENLVDTYIENKEETFCVGGAPLNVAVNLARSNNDSYFISKVSNDLYGKSIIDTLKDNGVKLDYIVTTDEYKSTKSIVTIINGDRSFSFDRDNTADIMLSPDDIEDAYFEGAKLIHFCSVGLVDSPSKKAHKKALEIAKEKGLIISFDVNLRINLYPSIKDCTNTVLRFMKYPNIVKLTDEELYVILGAKTTEQGVKILFNAYSNIDIVFITLGDGGAICFDRDGNSIKVEAKKIDPIDTTGAGDMFCACYINYVLNNGLKKSSKDYENCLNDAMEKCSKVCLQKGAI